MPGRLSALAVAGGTPASAAFWGSHAAGCGCGGFRSRAASSEKRGSLHGVRRGFLEEGALELGLEEALARGVGAAVTLGRARGVRCWGPVGSRGADGLIAGTGDTGSHQSPGGDGRAVQGRRGRLSTPGSGPLTAARAVRPPSLGTGHERAGRAGGLQRGGLQGPRARGRPRPPRGDAVRRPRPPRLPPPRPSIPSGLVFLFSPRCSSASDENQSIPDAVSGGSQAGTPAPSVTSGGSGLATVWPPCPRLHRGTHTPPKVLRTVGQSDAGVAGPGS